MANQTTPNKLWRRAQGLLRKRLPARAAELDAAEPAAKGSLSEIQMRRIKIPTRVMDTPLTPVLRDSATPQSQHGPPPPAKAGAAIMKGSGSTPGPIPMWPYHNRPPTPQERFGKTFAILSGLWHILLKVLTGLWPVLVKAFTWLSQVLLPTLHFLRIHLFGLSGQIQVWLHPLIDRRLPKVLVPLARAVAGPLVLAIMAACIMSCVFICAAWRRRRQVYRHYTPLGGSDQFRVHSEGVGDGDSDHDDPATIRVVSL